MSSISGASSSNRLPGLATGMDTDAMVKAMTANYQLKIDKMGQDKQIVQWKQEFYREVIKDIKGLQDYFDPISDKYIMAESKFNPMKTTNSNEGALGITAGATAQEGTYKINVTQLAKPAVIEGDTLKLKAGATSTTVGLDTKMSDLDPSISDNVTFTINGKNITTTGINGDTTIKGLTDEINTKINENPDLKGKVTASFDELSKKIVFSSTATGNTDPINPELKVDASVLGFSGLKEANGQNANFKLTYPDGRVVDVPDITGTITQSSNQFTANGITYNLKAAGTGDITFTIQKNNSDDVVKNIKSFITDYNKIVDKIEGKLSEKRQFSYKPLTDEQRKEMKEDDIKKWEEKAKQGILRNDDYLEQLMGKLRGSFFEPVYNDKAGDTKNSFHMGNFGTGALGLDTSSDSKERGRLYIKDEEKLKAAITSNLEEFTNFFIGKTDETSTPDTYVGSTNYYEDGLFTRMDKIIREYAGDPGIGKEGTSTLKGSLNIFANKQYDFSITGMAGKNTMPDQVYNKTLSISKLQKKMAEAQERYYTRFAQLETAMNKMNSQMASLSSQFGISG